MWIISRVLVLLWTFKHSGVLETAPILEYQGKFFTVRSAYDSSASNSKTFTAFYIHIFKRAKQIFVLL